MLLLIIFLAGLCLGSFVNAYVWRTHELSKPKSKQKASAKKLSIAKGKSMCVHCGHQLAGKDLVPVLSWLSLKGRCRYCHKPISWQYPLVELTTACLFVVSFINWPQGLGIAHQQVYFVCWLVLLTMFMALAVYDLRWMLLPNSMVAISGIVVAVATAVNAVGTQNAGVVVDAAVGLLAYGGVFWVLFQVSAGKWIGGGDVKLGFVLGAWLASPILSFMAIFIASLAGTLIAVGAIITKKMSLKTLVPFGPLLIFGTIVVTLFGQSIVNAYSDIFLVL